MNDSQQHKKAAAKRTALLLALVALAFYAGFYFVMANK